MIEKLLEVFVGQNWAPATAALSGMLIHLLFISAFFLYIYKKDGKQQTIKVLFIFGGFNYISRASKYVDAKPSWCLLLASVFAIIGLYLVLTSGMIIGATLSAKEKDKLLTKLK